MGARQAAHVRGRVVQAAAEQNTAVAVALRLGRAAPCWSLARLRRWGGASQCQ